MRICIKCVSLLYDYMFVLLRHVSPIYFYVKSTQMRVVHLMLLLFGLDERTLCVYIVVCEQVSWTVYVKIPRKSSCMKNRVSCILHVCERWVMRLDSHLLSLVVPLSCVY
jgi:hypothetical protein